jgi:general secretion pathway protein G
MLTLLSIALIATSSSASDNKSTTMQNMKSLSLALDLYWLDTGDYPCTSQGLDALKSNIEHKARWKGPYVGRKLVDAWRNDFVYKYNCSTSDKKYLLYSKGKNGLDENRRNDDILFIKNP